MKGQLHVWDAAVAGAGPAGSFAALLLARSGCAVVLLEKDVFPRGKVCGCCLGARGAQLLRRHGLGNALARAGAHPLRHLQLHQGKDTARLCLAEGGIALSRRTLDDLLAGAARDAGVDFRQGVRASACRAGGWMVKAAAPGHPPQHLEARAVIGATGLQGRLTPQDQPVHLMSGSRIGAGAQLPPSRHVPPQSIQMIVHRCGYAGLVALEDGTVDLAAALDPRWAAAHPGRLAGAAAEILRSARHPLADQAAQACWRGTPPLTRRRASGAPPGLFFIGDAAGYAEPFTGEGMTWGLEDAAAAADFIGARLAPGFSPDLMHRWEADRARARSARERPCRALSALISRPVLSRAAIAVLGAAPALAAPLIATMQRPPRPLLGGSPG